MAAGKADLAIQAKGWAGVFQPRVLVFVVRKYLMGIDNEPAGSVTDRLGRMLLWSFKFSAMD